MIALLSLAVALIFLAAICLIVWICYKLINDMEIAFLMAVLTMIIVGAAWALSYNVLSEVLK